MATASEAKAFRRRIGFDSSDIAGMSQATVDEIFVQVGEEYPDSGSPALSAVIIYLEGLFVNTAKLVNFKKNQTSKDAGDMFTHIKELIAYYKGELLAIENGLAAEDGNVRSGKPSHRTRAGDYSIYWGW